MQLAFFMAKAEFGQKILSPGVTDLTQRAQILLSLLNEYPKAFAAAAAAAVFLPIAFMAGPAAGLIAGVAALAALTAYASTKLGGGLFGAENDQMTAEGEVLDRKRHAREKASRDLQEAKNALLERANALHQVGDATIASSVKKESELNSLLVDRVKLMALMQSSVSRTSDDYKHWRDNLNLINDLIALQAEKDPEKKLRMEQAALIKQRKIVASEPALTTTQKEYDERAKPIDEEIKKKKALIAEIDLKASKGVRREWMSTEEQTAFDFEQERKKTLQGEIAAAESKKGEFPVGKSTKESETAKRDRLDSLDSQIKAKGAEADITGRNEARALELKYQYAVLENNRKTMTHEERLTELKREQAELAKFISEHGAEMTDKNRAQAMLDLEEIHGKLMSEEKPKARGGSAILNDQERRGASYGAGVTLMDTAKSMDRKLGILVLQGARNMSGGLRQSDAVFGQR
jgi:hypothetical protein